MDITKFYNHQKMIKEVQAGMAIFENTDFQKFYNKRKSAISKFKIGDVIDNNGTLFKIIDVKDDNLEVISLLHLTKSGKIKKNCYTSNVNPLHVKKIGE